MKRVKGKKDSNYVLMLPVTAPKMSKLCHIMTGFMHLSISAQCLVTSLGAGLSIMKWKNVIDQKPSGQKKKAESECSIKEKKKTNRHQQNVEAISHRVANDS